MLSAKSRKGRTYLARCLGVLISLLLLFMPLPFLAPGYQSPAWRLSYALAVLTLLISWWIGLEISHSKRISKRFFWILFASAVCLSIFAIYSPPLSSVFNALISFGSLLLTICCLGSLKGPWGKSIPAPSLIALTLTIVLIFGMEASLQAVPERFFTRHAAKAPPLAEPDRGREVFELHGFRGRRPCRNCPEHIRIVTMGGSSTYGIPLYYTTETFPSHFQRMLRERRPSEKYEVLNGGVPGFGIIQILDTLQEYVLDSKPDIVIINSWFNDSAMLPGWWGFRDRSDKDAWLELRILWKLDQHPLYQRLHRTRLYALSRFVLLATRDKLASALTKEKKEEEERAKRQRTSPAEFAWAMEEIIKLAERHDFLPVFLTEALDRSHPLEKAKKSNRYYQTILEVAARHDIPVVDTATAISDYPDAWLFFDFIHPNWAGHRIIAEEVYTNLFNPPPESRAARFLASRNVDIGLADVRREVFSQFPAHELGTNKITFEARLPFAKQKRAMLHYQIAGEVGHALMPLTADWQRVELDLSSKAFMTPIVDLRFTASLLRDPADSSYKVGKTGLALPAHVVVESGGKNYGWKVNIAINGQRLDPNSRGYNILVLESDSARVIETAAFDIFGDSGQTAHLAAYVEDLEKKQKEDNTSLVVIVAVNTDGFQNADPKVLADALKRLGGSGNLPGPFESYALIGSPGAKPGSAIEELGPRLVELSLGSADEAWAELIEVRNSDILSQ